MSEDEEIAEAWKAAMGMYAEWCGLRGFNPEEIHKRTKKQRLAFVKWMATRMAEIYGPDQLRGITADYVNDAYQDIVVRRGYRYSGRTN